MTENKYASSNTQIYESVGGFCFNYAKENNDIDELNNMTFTKREKYCKNLLIPENHKYYLGNRAYPLPRKYQNMLDFINDKKNKSVSKKIKTSIVLLDLILSKNNEKNIKDVLWYGQNTGENEKTTADIMIRYENGENEKISLKEGSSYYLLNSTFNRLLSQFHISDNDLDNYYDNVVKLCYDFLTNEEQSYIRKMLDFRIKVHCTRSMNTIKKNIRENINKFENTNSNLYKNKYILKQTLEIKLIENNINNINIEKFIKENIIEKNKNVRLYNLRKKTWKEEKKTSDNIEYLSKNINDIKNCTFENDSKQKARFFILIHFNDSTTIRVECSLRSDKSKSSGHKLAQYNNKFNIKKV
jgi:hypothetical protein